MRVLQLIDSLDAGGAERVAVNFANGLSETLDAGFLCATRHEGLLKSSISPKVKYLHLEKKKAVDLKALFMLKNFIKKEAINIIHAHSTSIFTAVLVKLIGAKVKIVWHDHYGKSDFINLRPYKLLNFCALFIKHSFCVNDALVIWSKNVLKIDNVSYLPNFVTYSKQENKTILKGEKGFRIVCLANLREQKDHFNLINAFEIVSKEESKYTLHLVGKDFKDTYSEQIKTLVESKNLEHKIFIYGSCVDTFEILQQANIGVLSSKSEGLPLALLEYGLTGLPTICTNVGDCDKVVRHNENGLLVEPNNALELSKSLDMLVANPILAKNFGAALKNTIKNNYSKPVIFEQVIKVYNTL